MMKAKRKHSNLLAALLVTASASFGLVHLDKVSLMPLTVEAVTAQAETLSPKEHAEDILATLLDVYPSEQLPTFVLTEQTPEYVTAATTGSADQANFNILYFAEESAIEVDDQQLNQLTPIAAFEKETFETEEEAIEAVNQILDLQGEAVDLGYDLTGYMQGAAGSTYLNWQEGNWSLVVRANNAEEEDPVALAQAVVDYLEDVYLPAPETVGQITLGTSPTEEYDSNTIVWQEGNVLYRVSHFDAMQAIKMAGSISEPTEQ